MNTKGKMRHVKAWRMKTMYEVFGLACKAKGVAWDGTRKHRDRILGTPLLRRAIGV